MVRTLTRHRTSRLSDRPRPRHPESTPAPSVLAAASPETQPFAKNRNVSHGSGGHRVRDGGPAEQGGAQQHLHLVCTVVASLPIGSGGRKCRVSSLSPFARVLMPLTRVKPFFPSVCHLALDSNIGFAGHSCVISHPCHSLPLSQAVHCAPSPGQGLSPQRGNCLPPLPHCLTPPRLPPVVSLRNMASLTSSAVKSALGPGHGLERLPLPPPGGDHAQGQHGRAMWEAFWQLGVWTWAAK